MVVRRYGAGHTRLHSVHPPTPHTGTCFITTGQVTDQNGLDGTVEVVYGRDDLVPSYEVRKKTGDGGVEMILFLVMRTGGYIHWRVTRSDHWRLATPVISYIRLESRC